MSSSFVQTMVSQTMSLDLSKTIGGSRDLTGLCTDIFLIVIRMREAEDLGDPASLRKLILFYLGLFEKNCKAINVEPETIADAKYAMVGLIDETVLSIPGVCRDFWIGNPLQLDLFGDNIAGEEFYNKLNRMLVAPEKKKDILEVYYLCLSLGFEGKYKIFNQEERSALIDNLGRVLRRTRVRVSGGLSPHGRRAESGSRRARGGVPFPLWLPAAACAGICVAVWAILFFVNASEFHAILNTLKP
jgi:type VI secretion system protein ImpK